MSDTKNPLWKQLFGAVAGAAIAFVIYTTYTTVSGALQAVVILPTAPDVKYQNELRLSNTEGSYAERLLRRMQQAAWKLPTAMPGTVRRESESLQVTTNEELARNTPTGSTDIAGPNYARTTGTYENPVPFAVVSVSSSSASSSSISSHPPLSTAWLRRYQQPQTNNFDSSVSSASDAAVAAPLMGAQASAQAMVSSSSEGIWIPTGPVQRVRVTAPQSSSWSSSSREWVNQMVSSSVPTAVLAATATQKQEHLPQSGFGLGLITVAAVGAAIGRKKFKLT